MTKVKQMQESDSSLQTIGLKESRTILVIVLAMNCFMREAVKLMLPIIFIFRDIE